MKIKKSRARPPGAPGTPAKTDGSAIVLSLFLALLLASCTAPDTQHHIVISTRDQKLAILNHGTLLATYPVSTSKFGLGDSVRSSRTPLGEMVVAKKIGDNAPLGAVFKDRVRTGEIVAPNSLGRDPIVTRILWLRGREVQNANAFGRYIYIHGTPEERLIGMPASYGCIRMRSVDVVQLYNIVGVGAAVTIVETPLVSAIPGMASAHSMGPENTAPFVMR
jgi:lipoprotein-anchoring transpeptidase ErfK/SrfK